MFKKLTISRRHSSSLSFQFKTSDRIKKAFSLKKSFLSLSLISKSSQWTFMNKMEKAFSLKAFNKAFESSDLSLTTPCLKVFWMRLNKIWTYRITHEQRKQHFDLFNGFLSSAPDTSLPLFDPSSFNISFDSLLRISSRVVSWLGETVCVKLKCVWRSAMFSSSKISFMSPFLWSSSFGCSLCL